MNAHAGRTIWILGGTSAIAQAYARLAAEGGAKLVLFGRNEEHLRANAADLVARGGSAVVEVVDLAGPVDHDASVDRWTEQHGFPEEVLVAYGLTGEQERALTDLPHAAE